MAEILSKLSIQSKGVRSNKLLYFSPLHKEKTALFEVNTKTNRWYDHWQEIGGSPVDFVCAYLKYTHEACTETDALRWLKNMAVSQDETALICINAPEEKQLKSALILKSKKQIQHLGLIRYLEKLGIPLGVAQRFLKEIRVYNAQTKQNFTAFGLPNEEGGFALRNPFYNDCLGSQGITFIRGRTAKPASIHLFNDVMDYLSVMSHLNGKGFNGDTIVLNSLSCLKQIIPYIQNYGYCRAYTWMDNDATGEKATAWLNTFFKTQINLVHKPMNKTYAPHKNVHAWHMHQKRLVP
jgi:hypothetical protein